MFYSLAQLLDILLHERAQGLHLYPGERPVVEVTRTLFRVSGPPLEPGDTDILLRQVASAEEYREFQSSRILSWYYQIEGKAVFNVLAFKEDDHVRLEIRSMGQAIVR